MHWYMLFEILLDIVSSRDVFRNLSNILDEVFRENSLRHSAVSFFRKKLDFRCLKGLSICLCQENKICTLYYR